MASNKSDHKDNAGTTGSSRREFVQKAVYVAPLVTTLHAAPSFAGTGSARRPRGSKGSSGGSWGSNGSSGGSWGSRGSSGGSY